MSAATEGFSAMISAFDIESVQKKKPPDRGGFSLVFFQDNSMPRRSCTRIPTGSGFARALAPIS
jgi:hypothetical protein